MAELYDDGQWKERDGWVAWHQNWWGAGNPTLWTQDPETAAVWYLRGMRVMKSTKGKWVDIDDAYA